MDYKKKYKEALKRAKNLHKDAIEMENNMTTKTCEIIFPELKENEDERIRRNIIAALKGEGYYDCDLTNECIAWLEKQSNTSNKATYTQEVEVGNGNIKALVTEDIPIDNVKPKFHEGDWITNGYDTWKIVEVKPLDYILQSQDGNIVDDTISYVDEMFDSWTVQDAKDGDVLVSRSPFIYGEQCPYGGLDWCTDKFIKASNFIFTDSPVHPATKAQRDALMKAMTDAGYTFDFEKKELKKIEQKPYGQRKECLNCQCNYAGVCNKGYCQMKREEKKPAWGEKDEKMLNDAIGAVGAADYYTYDDKQEIENWLKSLKQRIKGK